MLKHLRTESFTCSDRRHSEDNILSNHGSLRRTLRSTKPKERAAIPVFETGGLSPLKQLQRMNESGTYQTLPRSNSNKKQTDSLDGRSDKENKDLLIIEKGLSKSVDELSTTVVDSDITAYTAVDSDITAYTAVGSDVHVDMGNMLSRRSILKKSDTNGNVTVMVSDHNKNVPDSKDDIIQSPDDWNAKYTVDHNIPIAENYYRTIYAPKTPVLSITKPETLQKRKVPQLPFSTSKPAAPPKPVHVKKPIVARSTPISRPIVNVKLIKHEMRHSSQMDGNRSNRTSKSADDLDKSVVAADILDLSVGYTKPKDSMPMRDSFMPDDDSPTNRESIYHSVGDVQTLLKSTFADGERIYSLPQPQCYGDTTMKAVKKITEKYDTLQRRKNRAMSFRESSKTPGVGTGSDGSSLEAETEPTSPVTPVNMDLMNTTADEVFMENIPANVVCVTSGITQKDIARIDLFYRGQGTQITVCQCLADICEGTSSPGGDSFNWEPVKHTGVPVLVFNTGQAKRVRELYVSIAERETGFPLWKDKINYLSNYHDVKEDVHIMHLSNNLRKVMSINFYCKAAAAEFANIFKEITKDPNDDLWKLGVSTDKKTKKRLWFSRKFKLKTTSKTEISQPCNFTHITKVDPKDLTLENSFCDMINASKVMSTASAAPTPQTERFRPRLSTT